MMNQAAQFQVISATAFRIRILLGAVLIALGATMATALIQETPANAATAGAFSAPLTVGYGADPSMAFYNGNYYLLYNQGESNQITMKEAPSLAGLKNAGNVTVYKADSNTGCCDIGFGGFLFHYSSHWYIYDNGDDGNVDNSQQFVLESSGDDPLGPYTYEGSLAAPGPNNSGYAFSPFIVNGALYAMSTSDGNGTSYNSIYIATMSSPTTLSSGWTLISQPVSSGWECADSRCIDEGSSVMVHDGTIYDLFSAGGYESPDYCVGMLTASATATLTSAASWTKSSGCVVSRNDTAGVYGPGSMTWFTSPDGTQDWVIYHVKTTSAINTSGTDRVLEAAPVSWTTSGPQFTQPYEVGTFQALPSGDPGTSLFEAESGTVTDAQVRSSSLASGGEYVGGIDNSDSSVAFTVPESQAGSYTFRVYYDNAWTATATQSLSVNGIPTQTITYPITGTSWGTFNNDDYATFTVELGAGNNTLTFTHQSNYAELDRIEAVPNGTLTQVPGAAVNVSVGTDGTIVAVASDNRVWEYTGTGTSPWTEITGQALTRVAVRSANDIWGLAPDGSIWRYTGTWNQIAGGAFDIAVAADGTVLATAAGGTYQWTGGTSTTTWPDNWTLVPGSAPGGNALLVQVSGRSATDLWGVDSGNDIWHFNGSTWTQVAGGLVWVSEGADGTVEGVSGDSKVWLYTGTGALPWTQLPGSLSQVSVGNGLADVWGIDTGNEIWTTAI